jgi:hypothetical protein
MLDDHWRKAVAAVGDFGHRPSLSSALPPGYPVKLTKPKRNITAFGFVKRPVTRVTEEQWITNVRGPSLFA